MNKFLVILAAFFLAACAADYSASVTRFRDAVKTAHDGLVAMDEGARAVQAELAKRRYLVQPLANSDGANPSVSIVRDDCTSSADRCRVVVQVPKHDSMEPLEIQQPPSPQIPEVLEVMKSISAYAGGLSAIVSADTAENATASGKMALTNAQKSAGLIAKMLGRPQADVPQFAESSGNLFSWLIGEYVKTQQLHALREVVPNAQDAIAGLKEVGEELSKNYRTASAALFADAVSNGIQNLSLNGRSNGYDPTDPKQRARVGKLYDRVLADAAAFDAMLRGTKKGAGVFDQLVSAHEALNMGLSDENVTLEQTVAQIEAFANSASEFYEQSKAIVDAIAATPKEN